MNINKITPVGLYLKDLRTSSKFKSVDIVTASSLYKNLCVSEKERYDLLAKRNNERYADCNKTLTTQRDTIGLNLKEVSDCKDRHKNWEKGALDILKDLAMGDDILKRIFVVVQVGGVYFSRANDCQAGYATGEISFVKFNFTKGIIDSLVIFPECVKVPIGYRESLYEDLEEAVGWRPDTFRHNTSLDDCSEQIREFFNGVYPPVFVITKEQQEEVGMSLYNMYEEIGQQCPWIHSIQDWGQHCTIYRFDSLLSNILNKKIPTNSNSEKGLTAADVREQWLQMNANTASQCCERHQQYGLANQCPNDIIVKNLYSSLLLMHSLYKDEMHAIRTMVSDDFFKNLDFILKQPLEPIMRQNVLRVESTGYWNNYVLSQSGVEDVINRLEAFSVNDNSNKVAGPMDRVGCDPMTVGRGRGVIKNTVNTVCPGQQTPLEKMRLPNVIC